MQVKKKNVTTNELLPNTITKSNRRYGYNNRNPLRCVFIL